MAARRDEAFADFAAAALPDLRRLGYLLGGDWHRADDLVQSTLERLYPLWGRLGHVEDVDAYARRVLTRIFLAEQRRLWRRRETPRAEPADAAGERLDVRALLAGLPPRQRAAVVLRYLEDRSVHEVAALLQVSTGTVKRHCHDALRRLRALLADGTDLDLDGALTPSHRPTRDGG